MLCRLALFGKIDILMISQDTGCTDPRPEWIKVNGFYLPSRKYSAIKYNAARRGIPFDLSRDYLDMLWVIQQGRCYYTGEVLDISSRSGSTASLDRIDSNVGYVRNNVRWVHNDLNFMKHTLSESRFLEIIEKIHERKISN